MIKTPEHLTEETHDLQAINGVELTDDQRT